jgi:hypothetical protein
MLKMNVIFSNHALEQMKLRGISKESIQKILNNPGQISKFEKLTIYQGLEIISDKKFLIRIFINTFKNPPLIVTVYRTSKIDKYYES